MRKVFIFCLGFLLHVNGQAQSVQVSNGLNLSQIYHLYNPLKSSTSEIVAKNPGFGFSTLIGFPELKLGRHTYGFELGLYSYAANYYNSYTNGRGSYGYGTYLIFNKSVISLRYSPYKKTLKSGFSLTASLEVSFLLNEKFEHSSYGFDHLRQYSSYETQTDSDGTQKSNRMMYGLSTQLSYPIKVNERLSIHPRYSVYLGLGPEFRYNSRLRVWSNSLDFVCRWRIGEAKP